MAAASGSASRWVRAKAKVPLIGGSLAYMHDPLTLMRHLYDRHGPVAPLAMPGRTTAIGLGPDASGASLQKRDKKLQQVDRYRACDHQDTNT